MSWRVWGLDHCHGLKAGVARRLEYYISVWYCGWTLEGYTVQLSYPNFPLVYPNWGTVTCRAVQRELSYICWAKNPLEFGTSCVL